MISNGIESTILILIILILSIAIDIIFGELPTKIHPVVFIGKLIDFFSKYIINIKSRISGFILTALVSIICSIIFGLILFLASFNIFIFIIIATITLSSMFSIKMLISSARKIKEDLEKGIDIARISVSYLVSRKTSKLNENMIISATIETLSENITDSAIAPIFYYILTNMIIISIFKYLISPNILVFSNEINVFIVIIAILVTMLYRVINTLDAMVGYKNEKYLIIGYFPAKLDDILNYIPSRFGGISVVLASKFYKKLEMNWKSAYKIMKRDARNPLSPNSGFTMAAVAGALDIYLVKEGVYTIGDDKNNNKKTKTTNRGLRKEDIERSIKVSRSAIFIAIIVLISVFLVFSGII